MWTLLLALGALSCALQSAHGANFTITLDRTLHGEKLTGNAMAMVVSSSDKLLHINFKAPYVESDPVTNNRVHLFLADSNQRISEVEFTPVSSTLRMYWAPFNLLRTVAANDDLATFTATTEVSSSKTSWTGTATVHADLLPSRISLYNAANVHPERPMATTLQYDNLYSITNYAVALPDLMVLARYEELGPRFLFNKSEEYSSQWQAVQ